MATDVQRPASSPFYLERVGSLLTLRQLHSVLASGNGIDRVEELAPNHKKSVAFVWRLAKQSPQRLALQWTLVSSKLTKNNSSSSTSACKCRCLIQRLRSA